MKYEAALFDMDGVLLDSEPVHIAAFKAVLRQHGHQLSDDEYKQFFAGKTDEEGFRSYFGSKNYEVNISDIMQEKATAYIAFAADRLVPYFGVPELIRELADRLPLALVTGSLRHEALIALEAFGIRDCFKTIVAAEDISNSKPDPEGYLKAAAVLNADASKCVVIEDSPSGVRAAKSAGIHCIAVTTTHSPEELGLADEIVDKLDTTLFID